MKRRSFERMWKDILEEVRKRESVETLSHRVRNEILEVGERGITVRSERTLNSRYMSKETFRVYCNHLLKHGSLDFVEDIPRKHWIGVGAVVISIIALLPYVEYRTRPRILYVSD